MRRNIIIALGVSTIVLAGIGFLLVSTTTVQQDQAPDETFAGCNACEGKGAGCDWEQGFYSGCTNRDAEEKKKQEAIKEGKEYKTNVQRNNKPDVIDGVVQAGDQGRSGTNKDGKAKQAGQKVDDDSANPDKVVVAGQAHGVVTVFFPDGGKYDVNLQEVADANGLGDINNDDGVKQRAADIASNAISNLVGSDSFTEAEENGSFAAFQAAITGSGGGGGSDTVTREDLAIEGATTAGTCPSGKSLCRGNGIGNYCADLSAVDGQCQRANAIAEGYGIYNGPWSGNINGTPRCFGEADCANVSLDCSGRGCNVYTCNFDSPSDFANGFANGCDLQANSSVATFSSCSPGSISGGCGIVQCDNYNGDFYSYSDTSGCNFAAETLPASGVTFEPSEVELVVAPPFNSTSSTTTSGSSSSSGGSTGSPPIQTQCVYLDQTLPPAGGTYPPGQAFQYTAEFTCSGINSNLRLAVIDGSDNEVGTPTIVPIASDNYNPNTNTCVYTFNWTSTGLTDGDYDVRLLNNGSRGSEINNPAACTESLSIESTAPEQDVVTIVKSGSYICTEDGGAAITYFVTIRNIGNSNAQVDFVEDTLPSGINASSTTQVDNISPAPSSRTASTLRWDLNVSLQPNDSTIFTYRVNLNSAQVNSLNGSNLENIAVVQYGDNDSTAQFEHSLYLNCLPNTAIFTDNPILFVGLMMILLGILVNRGTPVLRLLGFEVGDSGMTAEIGGRIAAELSKTDTDRYQERLMEQMEGKRKK